MLQTLQTIQKKSSKLYYRQYKQKILEQLESLHENNPKLYLEFAVNNLRGQNCREEKSSAVDPSTWNSHFTNLNQIKDKFKQQVKVLEGQLKTLENVKIFNELYVSISQEEISKAISKLKNNKIPGL